MVAAMSKNDNIEYEYIRMFLTLHMWVYAWLSSGVFRTPASLRVTCESVHDS
jgi:hypothetical protein